MKMNKREVAAAVVASLTGIGVATAASAVVAYQKIFPRRERPNYALTPGDYFYPRVEDRLPREQFTYRAGKSRLAGYYYKADTGKGLIVIAHGIHAGGDDYIPLAEAFVREGYSVLSYDSTGTYDSEGDSTVGMCQQLIDLENTIKFVRGGELLKADKIFIAGHSWGAYATASVLNLRDDISAAACIAGMNSGPDMIVEKAKEYVGGLAQLPEPAFSVYQKYLFKHYVEYNAVDGINRRNIPVLIAHGVDDKTIRFNTQAIIARQPELKNPLVSYHIGRGLQGGHDTVWHSREAIAYGMEIKSELHLREMKKGSDLSDGERAELYATVDHRLFSAADPTLVENILTAFEKA